MALPRRVQRLLHEGELHGGRAWDNDKEIYSLESLEVKSVHRESGRGRESCRPAA